MHFSIGRAKQTKKKIEKFILQPRTRRATKLSGNYRQRLQHKVLFLYFFLLNAGRLLAPETLVKIQCGMHEIQVAKYVCQYFFDFQTYIHFSRGYAEG